MDVTLAGALQRAWARRVPMTVALAVTAFYLLLGHLGLFWALAGAIAVSLWAGLWPESSAAAQAQDAQSSGSETPGFGAPSGQSALPFSLLDGLADAALLLDARGAILAANSAAQAIQPTRPGNPLSQWCRAPELLAAVDRAKETGMPETCHVRLITPVERSLDVRVTPLTGPSGVTLIALRDLTEQEQLSRMRADFVANASHELRTPLASLRGFVETLQGAAKDDPVAQARFLGIMQTQAERMSRLIDDLLSLSRIEMREHVAPTATVDLAAVVEDAVSALRPVAETASITLNVTSSERPLAVIGDRDELAQVAQNLVQNAIKYGRAGGKVEIALRREGERAVLAVVDDGIGIAPEHVPRLTERFYRVSAKDSKERGGTGLGLAIVKHIVNRHRGELRITSTLGKGSAFSVAVPASPNDR